MRHDDPMRILFSSTPGLGHLLPMLPLARAARKRGHDVVIASGSSLADVAAAAGFPHEAMGPATIGAVVDDISELAGLTGRRRAVVTLRRAFCETIAPAMADGVSELAERWRPDVVVHEDRELGSWVAAERLGIPHVTVQATAWRPRMTDIGNEPLNTLRERYGLARDEGLAGLYGRLFLTTRPWSLRDGDAPMPEMTAELRPIADDRLASTVTPNEDPFPPRDGRARVAITLGTVNYDQVAVLRALIDGAVVAGAHVVVALGADPSSLGTVPAGVSVHAYVPMSVLLPAADLVAFHGGSGTMLAALAAGTPMLIVPFAADQPDNADRCLAAGVARVLTPKGLNAGAVKAAVEAIISGPDYRRRAREVADEVAAMPGPDAALDRIEAIVGSAGRSPDDVLSVHD
jgi:UDP:flavonoid glycosyltransferase YjiC (YdhE family)